MTRSTALAPFGNAGRSGGPRSARQDELGQCVYAGGDTCTTVTVPFVWVEGDLDYWCGGSPQTNACEIIGPR